jgi:hypothetical protein
MPFAVTRTPCGEDPRGPCVGTNYRQGNGCAPWRLWIQSNGALPPFDFLITGLLLQQNSSDETGVFFDAISIPPLMNVVRYLAITHALGAPPVIHIQLGLVLRPAVGFDHQGFIDILGPDPVIDWPSVNVAPTAGPDLVPNIVTTKIVAWNRTLPTY